MEIAQEKKKPYKEVKMKIIYLKRKNDLVYENSVWGVAPHWWVSIFRNRRICR